MAAKDRKKKRKKKGRGSKGSGGGSGGGVMRSMRGGFKRAVGRGQGGAAKKTKTSTLEWVITVVLFVAVAALLFYRFR